MDMLELTACDIRKMLISGETTSYALVCAYMRRIAEIDQAGPCLNSILEVNPDALHIASAMDRERAQGKVRSPLHGIPVLLKDNINTADKLRTTAGSLALADNYAPYDAALTVRLRKAGLVILGKANMTELSNFMSYTMKDGYSSRGGQVVNPYLPTGPVGGSSSGSAVAVSANLCALAIGTETNASIIEPACFSGIVGLKPTRGLVSRHGIVPISTAQDTAGPMARTVADCAALLNVMVGDDENDPSTWALEDKIPADYTAYLRKDGLNGLCIGVNDGCCAQCNAEQIALFENACAAMEKCGARLVRGIHLPNVNCDKTLLLYEFQKCLNSYLATVNTRCRTLQDIIDFYTAHTEGLQYGMSILLDAQQTTSGNCTEPAYLLDRLEALRITQTEGLERVMDVNKLNLLLSPILLDHAPVSGYPCMSVPVGYERTNMPYGAVLIARPFCEPLLIQAGYAFEQATHIRKPPMFSDLK